MVSTRTISIIKKSGVKEGFDPSKIEKAVGKSAERVDVNLSEEEYKKIERIVLHEIESDGSFDIPVAKMHIFVEKALDEVNPNVAKAYRDYRNYKQEFVHIMDEVLKMNQGIMYLADKSNANTDSSITSTKRSLLYKKLSRELYQQVFLKPDEVKMIKDGYIYIHDLGDRLHCSHNCCVMDFSRILRDGFEMSNVKYRPPKRLSSAFGIIRRCHN